ncbi:C-C chemokine receptor type 4 isoform X1 [Hippoglossus stenolepis]|uniref:C-C chemokine receptor type 4 isoform X1 n=2 Tax=Hippoglossus stenolepis TaxID=195615 RepID=UPI001FAFFE7B|nr:C-C chemokine receptor type 4 isoform X1 [Hippoglossus stenolepis]
MLLHFFVFSRKLIMDTILPVTAFSGNVTPTINHESGPTSSTEYYYYEIEDHRCVYDHHGAKYLPVLYSIFFLLGLLGNSLVIWVTICGVRLRSMTDVCLLNLAIADLLLVCSLPFLAHQARDQWLFGDIMCKVILGIYHIVFYCGIFFICLMSIDRYLAIVHAVYAIRARTRSFGLATAAVTWVAGFLASFPDLIFVKLHSDANMTQFCYPAYPSSDSSDTSFSNPHFWGVFSLFKRNILGLLIPALIMGFCYSQIVWRLLYCPSSKKQAIRLVLAVVVAFLCCWLPYNVASFFKALELLDVYTTCGRSKAIRLTLEVTEAIAYAHSCLNPILYVFVGEKFRRHLVRLINRSPCRLCQVIKVHIPQDRSGSMYSQATSVDERSTAV